MKRRGFITGAASLCASRSFAQTGADNALALSGDRFAMNGAEFMLADVLAPPLYVLDDETPPHFEASRSALQTLLSGVIEVEDVLPPTRWGVRPVIVRTSAATLQEILAATGAVRVAPQTDHHDVIRRLLALEAQARAERRGLWALSAYRVFDAADADGAVGAFNLIEGTVLTAEKHGSRFYLNFGEDFREDFTASAPSRLSARWAEDGFDLAALRGARVRVRGFVEAINGPSIDLNHPLQIERLD
ncbi:thermonuclease family protein [Hyphococcus sp.]|jgi:endonuclease YncB( thermonuclease family)|uniref:thermonuclease family protein n=1 Tax=Hyphococcus sp. TaxID=2038636 RepID=UPI003D0A6BD3